MQPPGRTTSRLLSVAQKRSPEHALGFGNEVRIYLKAENLDIVTLYGEFRS